jgi:hypothetical protein
MKPIFLCFRARPQSNSRTSLAGRYSRLRRPSNLNGRPSLFALCQDIPCMAQVDFATRLDWSHYRRKTLPLHAGHLISVQISSGLGFFKALLSNYAITSIPYLERQHTYTPVQLRGTLCRGAPPRSDRSFPNDRELVTLHFITAGAAGFYSEGLGEMFFLLLPIILQNVLFAHGRLLCARSARAPGCHQSACH